MSQADSENSISTPADPARRRFLTVAAGASVASVGTLAIAAMPAAAPEPDVTACAVDPALTLTAAKQTAYETDPAFALIRSKREADVLHHWAIERQDVAESQHGYPSNAAREAAERSRTACDRVNEIDWKLATTPPTTLFGVAAVLRLANLIEDGGGEWPNTDAIGPEGWHYQLRATMAAAIEALIMAHAEKAVQS
jgi:hypothetical protein